MTTPNQPKEKKWTNEQWDTTISMLCAFAGLFGLVGGIIYLDAKHDNTGTDRLFGRDIIIYLFGVITQWITSIISNHHGKKMAQMNQQNGGHHQ